MQQRQCVVLQGELAWCQRSTDTLLSDIKQPVIALSSNKFDGMTTSPAKQASRYLGQEFNAVVFDALEEFNPDSFGIIVGTIKAGGVLILWLADTENSSLFEQRLKRVYQKFEQNQPEFHTIKQGDDLPQLSLRQSEIQSIEAYHTDDQQQAVTAILKVVYGHRRRPLVLSADRGRGKSASLGIAAAELLLKGKQKIIVTAPSLAIAQTIFDHAAQLLPEADISSGLLTLNQAEIWFIAPDALIESLPKADCLLVDEAAAIPVAMLTQLLQHYSRIVFATTLHGYEGTGRGFAIRFHKVLTENTPDWKQFKMTTPIRWADDDALEAFSFQALLLNATPVDDELLSDLSIEQCHVEKLNVSQLANDEISLNTLFGLMVLAHYRTRPSDLRMMLDQADVSVYVLRYQGHIIASAWLVAEGQLDDDLSTAIHAGERRLKGHLLPQSLLAHAGITSAGSLRYQRIIRIAVHPTVQGQGLGLKLVENLCQHLETNVDIIGTSFAMDPQLFPFWIKSGFTITRLGLHKDEVSGSHSVMMLRSTSKQGQQMLNEAKLRFQQHWFDHLTTHFNQLAVDSVVSICQSLTAKALSLSALDEQEINAFSVKQRGLEFSEISLKKLIQTSVCQSQFLTLTSVQQQLAVMVFLQQRDKQYIANKLAYSGKKELTLALRGLIKILKLK
ncbi:MAG: tRNA cytosine(34) acetyltransferase TmcA [Gammaproteobacteria bacterium]|nr:MAG: tRNA cytosine(34) acetyltransferase TmcA [Gammaproteobacteria bacterium]